MNLRTIESKEPNATIYEAWEAARSWRLNQIDGIYVDWGQYRVLEEHSHFRPAGNQSDRLHLGYWSDMPVRLSES